MARNDHRDAAVTHLVDHEYRDAGDCYTRAAYSVLADPGEGRDLFADDGKGWFARGVAALTTAALCYRVAGLSDRAAHRGREAEAVAADQRDGVRSAAVDRALCEELVGDARVAGGHDDADAAYDRAAAGYEDAAPEDPLDWVTRPAFEAANRAVLHASRNTGSELAWDDLHGPDPSRATYLAHRARTKARRFPAIVRTLVDEGRLHPPRGTTEHDNDRYRCPECGTSEVNWIGEEVVCIDCSTRMVEQ